MGGEVGWSGVGNEVRGVLTHLFLGQGRSAKGQSCLRVGRKILTTPHCLQIFLSYPAMPLFIQQRVTKLLMCIRLRTWELGIGEPTQQCRMDVNQLLTGMNASLSTENSAPKRMWLCESVYQRKLTWPGEGLPEEVTPS